MLGIQQKAGRFDCASGNDHEIRGLFLEHLGLYRCLVLGASLGEGGERGLHVDADLVDQLLHAELVLAEAQLLGDHIGLRRAIAQRNGQLRSDGVVGKVAAEQLPQDIAVAADKK